MRYYEKLEVPKLPAALEAVCIKTMLQQHKTGMLRKFSYDKANITDNTKISYIDPSNEYFELYHKSGTVLMYDMPVPIRNMFEKLYANTDVLKNKYFYFKIVTPGSHLGAHTDPIQAGRYSINYMLDPGGEQVKTCWWKIKQEFEHLERVDNEPIPYSNLYKVDEVVLEKSNWYYMQLDEIHSVENLQNIRLMIGTI